jgi:hypothetical protein
MNRIRRAAGTGLSPQALRVTVMLHWPASARARTCESCLEELCRAPRCLVTFPLASPFGPTTLAALEKPTPAGSSDGKGTRHPVGLPDRFFGGLDRADEARLLEVIARRVRCPIENVPDGLFPGPPPTGAGT